MKDDRLHNLLLELYSGRTPTRAAIKDFDGREIIATPFDGHYGQAGWVLCVNGSPPRGCIVALETRDHQYVPASIFYLEMDKSRRLGTMQANIVRDYIAKLASADRNAPAAESGVSEQPTANGCIPMADASICDAATPPAGCGSEGEDVYGYLSRLFKHYAPQCEPLPTLSGVASQIDNLLCGMKSASEGEWIEGPPAEGERRLCCIDRDYLSVLTRRGDQMLDDANDDHWAWEPSVTVTAHWSIEPPRYTQPAAPAGGERGEA